MACGVLRCGAAEWLREAVRLARVHRVRDGQEVRHRVRRLRRLPRRHVLTRQRLGDLLRLHARRSQPREWIGRLHAVRGRDLQRLYGCELVRFVPCRRVLRDPGRGKRGADLRAMSGRVRDGATDRTARGIGRVARWLSRGGTTYSLARRYYNPDLGASSIVSCIGCVAGKANPIPGSYDAAVCNECLPGSVAPSNGTAICACTRV